MTNIPHPKSNNIEPVCKKATLKQIMHIRDIISDNIVANGDDTWTYINGYTDNKVAERIDGVTNNHVGRIRKELFGQLRQTPKASTDEIPQIKERLRDALRQIEFLEARIERLEKAWEPLT
jgi:inactivated superfamily I helicase